MRICLERATGKLIEMQSAARPGTLIRNAEVTGYTAADVEEKEITSTEWAEFQNALRTQRPPDPGRQKMKELLALGRCNWTDSQRNELIELVALDLTK